MLELLNLKLMHHNNITAEVLYSTRILSCSQRKSTFGAPRISYQAGVWPHQLDGKRSTRCALVKTKNRSLLRHRGFNIEDATFTT